MGLADLPTLADEQTRRRATPKYAIPTRLEEKIAADKTDAKALEQWAHAVRRRDRERCRVCGIRTVRTLELDPRRGEAHHIVSRTNPVIRVDVRNGLWTCGKCHSLLTRHKLFVIGTARQMFVAGRTGKSYLNGDDPGLQFKAKP
jgi:ribosomal protein L37AE/L43A